MPLRGTGAPSGAVWKAPRFPTHTEISEQHAEERIAWTTVGGDLKQAGVVTFHNPDENQTRVTIQMDWDPQGLVEKAGAAVGVDDRRVKAARRPERGNLHH